MKGQLDKAVRQYQKVLDELNGRPELADELALFNKLGDLYVKLGKTTSAVDEYEKAINHYAEQGFPNNAIALCNKVLRNAPGRTHIYLKLANLMMQRGFASEAKQNLLQYAERMQKAGKLEDAFHALKEFADLSPENEEIRLILAEQLKKAARTDEAREQLEKLYRELQGSGDDKKARATLEKMRSIDPEYDLDAAAPAPTHKAKRGKSTDIVFLDLDENIAPVSPDEIVEEPVVQLDVEATALAEESEDIAEAGGSVDIGLEATASEESVDGDVQVVAPVEGLDVGGSFGDADDLAVETLDIEATAIDDGLDVPEIEPVAELPELEATIPDDEFGEVGQGQADTLPADESQADASDELPILEVPSADEDIEVIGLEEQDEVPDDASRRSLEGLPMLDIPDQGEEVDVVDSDEDEDIDVPWDVGATEIPAEAPDGAMPDIASLEAAVMDDLDAPGPHRELGEALIEVGDRERGMLELGLALDAYEVAGDMRRTLDLTEEILKLDPNSIAHHQKRVEIVMGEGDEPQIIDAYLELADALLRCEDLDRSRAVYEQVVELDANNDRARIALQTLMADTDQVTAETQDVAELEVPDVFEPDRVEATVVEKETIEPAGAPDADELEIAVPDLDEPVADEPEASPVWGVEITEPNEVEPIDSAVDAAIEPLVSESASTEPTEPEEPVATETETPGGFVDLGALIMDEEEETKDTRMRIDRGVPVDEEEQDFVEMLSEFKKGIDANIDADDSQAHYDLGVAFKEMGLLDEAISEFQKALRGSEDRLRTSESLGLCFFEKGQFAVAATVLRRAIDSEPGDDDEKIGLLYWLGRCQQEQGRNQEALGYYQRIFSIDISFQDVSERVSSLTQTDG